MPLEYTFAAFGIAAAFILIGGSMFLRYQRDRHHFALMQTALDKGITTFPGMPPAWLISFRVGVLSLALGIGLFGAGLAIYVSADSIDLPPVNAPGPPPPPGYYNPNPVPAAPDVAPASYRLNQPALHFINAPNRGPGPPQGPPQGPPNARNQPNPQGPQGPPNQQNFQGQGPRPNPPGPQQAPAMERWHRIQNQPILGIIIGSAGAILLLLGIVRIAFARMERRYATELPHTP